MNRRNFILETIADLFNEFEQYAFSTTSSSNEEGAIIQLPIPGFKKDEIEISLENEFLIIEGKSDKILSFKKPFTKRYKLSSELDFDSIEAKHEDGVLTININREKKYRNNKKIKIS